MTSTTPAAPAVGKRRATRAATPRRTPLIGSHSGSRGPLFRGLPSMPMVAGVATLALALTGAVQSAPSTDQISPTAASASEQVRRASALSGTSTSAAVNLLGERSGIVSRNANQAPLAGTASADVIADAEKANRQRNAALTQFREQVEKQSRKIKRNAWVLPVSGYRLSAHFGAASYLWSRLHTGLDFAAPSGTPIVAVAGGTVTEAGWDGSYGYKMVITLEDGTEIWYAHQTSFAASVGETVRSGDLIGYVGSTGNSTGPHLHLEVRPGGGDPVDPYSALIVHGLVP